MIASPHLQPAMVHKQSRRRICESFLRLIFLTNVRDCWAARTLFQSDNSVCLAFIPYRSDDYEYMREISTGKRRREAFPYARERCIAIGETLPTEGEPWDYQGLKGTIHLASEPEALQAFPKMNKRSDDLYSAFIIACIQDMTGFDLNDNVGKSTRKPYYFVHTVCKNNCASFTPEQQVNIDTSARNARAVISCADSAAIAADPFALRLPFTPEDLLPNGTRQAANFVAALQASSSGVPVTFQTPGAKEDLQAALTDSDAPLEDLLIPSALFPAPAPGAFATLFAPAPAPSFAPEIAPDKARGPAPGAAAPGPALDEEAGQDGKGGDIEGGDEGDGDSGVNSKQTSSRDGGNSRDISWILVAVGFVAAIILGVGIMIARHFGIALGYSCCQCTACGAFLVRKGSSDMAITPTAATGGPAASSSFKASAFESADGPLVPTTSGPGLLGGAHSSSGDDSVDFSPAPAGPSSSGTTSRAGVLGLTSAVSGSSLAGVGGPQGVVYRTTSHSGSVSLAHLTPHIPGMATSASNGKESQGGESSDTSGNAASGDSSHLPALLGTAGSGSCTTPAYENMERPDSIGEDRGARVLGTVFEIESQAPDTEAQHITAATLELPKVAGDSAGLTKPLDEITASMLEGDRSPVESLNGQGSGASAASDDALLNHRAARSDFDMVATTSADTAASSPRRRRVFSSLLPAISFRSSSGPDVSAQESAGAGTSASGPAPPG